MIRGKLVSSKRLQRVALVITLALALPTGSALALFGGFGGIIFDPSNFAQNVHQVIALFQQIERATTQIRLQQQMLAHLPVSIANELTLAGQALTNQPALAIPDGGTLSTRVGESLEINYPITFAPVKPAWLDEIRPTWLESHREQVLLESNLLEHVHSQMPVTASHLTTLIEASNGVNAKSDERPGVTAVAQAHVELLVLCSGEADKLIALRVARAKRHSDARAQGQSEEAYQTARRESLMLYWNLGAQPPPSAVRFPFTSPLVVTSGVKP